MSGKGKGFGMPPKRNGKNSNNGKSEEAKPPTDLDRIIAEIAGRDISLRVGGEAQSMTMLQALFFKIMESGLSGNSYSQRLAMRLIADSEAAVRAEQAERAENWRNYQRTKRAEIEEAKCRGEPEPVLYPHPDDIIIEDDDTVRIPGPIDEAEARKFNDLIRLRDLLLLQDHYEQRKGVLPEGEDGSGLLLATFLNYLLPERLQLSDSEIAAVAFQPPRQTKRELQAILYREWRALVGPQIRRGVTLPPQRIVEPRLKLLAACLQRMRDGRLQVKDRELEDIAADIEAIAQEEKIVLRGRAA
jgi:hypothetical protein